MTVAVGCGSCSQPLTGRLPATDRPGPPPWCCPARAQLLLAVALAAGVFVVVPRGVTVGSIQVRGGWAVVGWLGGCEVVVGGWVVARGWWGGVQSWEGMGGGTVAAGGCGMRAGGS